jgi:hypothetical protein
MQQRLVARAADIGKHWPELPVAKPLNHLNCTTLHACVHWKKSAVFLGFFSMAWGRSSR